MQRQFITDKFSGLDKGPIDVAAYHDPSFFDKEKEAIFRRSWLMAGRVEQIPNAGDYFTRTVPMFKMSLIVIRGKDGEVRTFQNACRHRGNQICLEKKGNTPSLTCKFHSWNYDLKGRLIGIPDAGGMFNLNKDELGLIQVQTQIWNGFIFFNLNDENETSLSEYLGGIGPALTGYPFNAGTSRFQIACSLKSNWKSVIDSFAETYHVPSLHRFSIAETLAGGGNPFGHLVDAVEYGNHRTASVWGNKSYRPKPFQQIAYEFAGDGGAAITSGQGGAPRDLPTGINPSRSENWGIDVNVIFPNLVIVIGPGSYFCHQMWPTAAGHTEWEMTGFWRPALTAAQRIVQEYFMVELRDTVMEDLNTLERVQSNIENGVVKQIYYHDHEVALRCHYHTVRSAVDAYEFR